MKTGTQLTQKAIIPANKAPIPVPKPSHDDAPAPDIATQLGAAVQGHSFGALNISPAPLGAIQPKLTVGAPDDKYEDEADRVAGQVMRMPDNAVQRVTPDEDEDKIQTKPDMQRKADGRFDAGASAESRIAARQGGGSPLPDATRAFMEPRFGADFSDVRVHADGEASQLSQELSARAFTTGRDIYFRQGEYSPASAGGQELLAHELTHVVQQGQVSATIQRATIPEIDEAFQRYVILTQKIREVVNKDGDATEIIKSIAPLVEELHGLAKYVAKDDDHEIYKSAYGGIYNYIDRLITQLEPLIGTKNLAGLPLPEILDLMRRATARVYSRKDVEDARQHPVKYTASLGKIDVDGTGLKDVIAQAAYMSGDMFGVAAALRLDAKLGVVIFYDHKKNIDREIETKLLDFYKLKDGTHHPRVALIPVTDSAAAYKSAVAGDFSNKKLFPYGEPKILSDVHYCLSIGHATRIVANAYENDAEHARQKLENEWLPEGAKQGTAKGPESEMTIAEWVAEKGFNTKSSYAFIWFRRSGEKGGAHKELDTSEAATRQIIQVAKKGQAADKFVIIGDKGHSLSKIADIDLTEFWDDPKSPFKGSGRKMQLALFAYLVNNKFNIMNIGMRSGALEGPALLGVKTVFLEEKYNLQEGRMDQWQGAVPGFKRVELEHVPTEAGKVELDRLIDLTIKSSVYDYKLALAAIDQLDKGAKDLVLKQGKFEEFASQGISVNASLYNPQDVAVILRSILKSIEEKKGQKIDGLFGGKKQEILNEIRKAIRAYHEWCKGLVKDRLAKSYQGPKEGLNEEDKHKMWEAVATNVGGWQTVKKY